MKLDIDSYYRGNCRRGFPSTGFGRTTIACAIATLAALGACGGATTVDSNPATNQHDPASVTVTAPRSTVTLGESIQLSASAKDASGNPTAAAVTWSVAGIAGGDTVVGKIDANGRYVAPALVPAQNPVRISASVTSAPSVGGSASIVVAAAPAQGMWMAFQPNALNSSATGQVLMMANAPDGTSRVELVPSDGGAAIPFTPLGNTLFQGSVPASRILHAYQSGDLHAVAGFLDFYSGAARTTRLNVVQNVRDATVPDVTVTARAGDAQRSAHVVNIRFDSLFLGGGIPPAVPRRFYQLFGDDYDFLAVVEQVNVIANRNYQAVRNSETGFGASQFDRSAIVGSGGHILGMVDYPNSSFFDLAETGSIHEIGHRWMSYLPGAMSSGAHWPISDYAYGIMGFSLPGGEGGQFPFTLTPAGSDYQVRTASPATRYNDLELYLMGLAPASEVGTHFLFQNQNQSSEIRNGGLLRGPVTQFTVNDVIAAVGPRVPGYGQAQTSFGLATIVLSYGRLLSREEMAYFDFMAARGEATTPLHYTVGLASGTTLPFALATNGRGRLSTAIR